MSVYMIACTVLLFLLIIAILKIVKLVSENASYQKENEELANKLAKALAGDLSFETILEEGETVGVNVKGGVVHTFCGFFINEFKASGATNFLEFGFSDAETYERYIMTIQKVGALRPTDKISELVSICGELVKATDNTQKAKLMSRVHKLAGGQVND
ncbi:hypothetical protein I3271_07455 [Photobacterium leiognathi]|uniref:hypothetical protein n=1 Tax=Photobacterium leiognathi TaxID=553611 RepID=UPI001EDCDC51|nr:hypothetical protein [Photobacterium leiognathi]MCG3884522.1 hypothetical protein [Photobacterium leiognathi]